MTRTRTLEPAFPRTYGADGHNGMDLRDYFAAKAMQGYITTELKGFQDIAERSYLQADAMMKAREQ